MPICSYLVMSAQGTAAAVRQQLAALPGCADVRAATPDMLLLVTDTAGPDDEQALRDRVANLGNVRDLVLVFGEIAPETPTTPSSRGNLP